MYISLTASSSSKFDISCEACDSFEDSASRCQIKSIGEMKCATINRKKGVLEWKECRDGGSLVWFFLLSSQALKTDEFGSDLDLLFCLRFEINFLISLLDNHRLSSIVIVHIPPRNTLPPQTLLVQQLAYTLMDTTTDTIYIDNPKLLNNSPP